MSAQLEIFGGDLPRSFPPHLDPAKVKACRIRSDIDRDHVGKDEIGRFGNNAGVFVFEVIGECEVVLYAESCATIEAAEEQLEQHECALEAHRQRELF